MTASCNQSAKLSINFNVAIFFTKKFLQKRGVFGFLYCYSGIQGIKSRKRKATKRSIITTYLKLIKRSGIRADNSESIKIIANSMILDRLCAPKPNAVNPTQKRAGAKIIVVFLKNLFMLCFNELET